MTLIKFAFLTITATLLGSTAMASDLLVEVPASSSTVDLPSQYFFSLEALAIGRTGTDAVLYHDDDNNQAEYSIDDLVDDSTGYGLRVGLGGSIDDEWGFALSALYVGGFGSSGLNVDAGNDLDAVFDDDFLGDFDFSYADNFQGIEIDEGGYLAGLEANLAYDWGGAQLFFGPRWLRYNSSLDVSFYDDVNDYEGTDNEIDQVSISSTNDLFGGQIGIAGMVDIADGIKLGGRAAVGLYYNSASLDRDFSSDASPFLTDSVEDTSTSGGFAQSIELSPAVEFAASENLSITLGANLIWFNGVDEPGDHLAGIGADDGSGDLAGDEPGFDRSVLFTGLSAGLKGTF
jgi:hypothetical protein